MKRGQLRVYFGAAPGVGKTYAMLEEGTRRRERGTDVVIGYVEGHRRPHTIAAQRDLEVVPRRSWEHRGVRLEEMDLDAVLARNPEVALVDELAHTNAPGSRHEKRWQDVDELLNAGIDVISTVNLQHLESLSDVVSQITGAEQRETVPDAFVRSAEQIHFVDQTAEALRRRMAHGNVYAPDQVDAALSNFFRVGNLGALRELALMWVADRVDDELQRYKEAQGITAPWETRERVVVALTGAPTGDALIRRAARIAERSRGDLIGVHVRAGEGVATGGGGSDVELERQKQLLASLGGTVREAAGADVADALLRAARSAGATQLLLGASDRSRLNQLIRGSVINEVIARSGPIDVHVISRPEAEGGAEEEQTVSSSRSPRSTLDAALPDGFRHGLVRVSPATFGRRRITWSWAMAVLLPPLVTALLVLGGDSLDRSSQLLAFTLVVALIALAGGFLPAVVASVSSFLLANWFFTPPIHTWTVAQPEALISLVVFVTVAAIIGFYVSVAARRSLESARARSQAETLAAMAGAMGSTSPLTALVAQARAAFGARVAAVLLRDEDGRWRPATVVGPEPPDRPEDAAASAALGGRAVLVLDGEDLNDLDPAVFSAFCVNLGAALERDRLNLEAARADRLAEADRLRSGLLTAVSHDLRTPLAAIKAASSTLVQRDAAWPEAVRDELTAGIDEQVDRLTALVENLLTMSRIQAGAVHLEKSATEVGDTVGAALALVDRRGHEVVVDVERAPSVLADPHLLERVFGNLIDNACKWSPPGEAVTVDADEVGGSVVVRVVDRGPGIPRGRREEAFTPFQRLGDTAGVEGTGLGLAIAAGFVQAMGGTIEIDDTPGGGTTMSISLPIAAATEPAPQ